MVTGLRVMERECMEGADHISRLETLVKENGITLTKPVAEHIKGGWILWLDFESGTIDRILDVLEKNGYMGCF